MVGKNNRFKLYPDKNSLSKKYTRMLNGGETEIKGDKLGWWERKSFEKNISSDIRVTIPEIFNKRPDLMAFTVYGKTEVFWLVLQYNNIVDVEEEFVTGKQIILPSRIRALSSLVNNNEIVETI